MKIKAFLMAALLFCGAMSASAQSKGNLRLGATAGMNVANITDSKMDSRIGFNAGLRGEYYFTNGLYGSLGLLFTQKGCRKEETLANVKTTYSMYPGYLELPIAVGYRFDLGNDVAIFGETGPYLAVGVCGKHKVEVNNRSEKADFFGDNGANRFDGGWGLRAGVEVSGFQIHLGYEYGFSKIYDNFDRHNSNFNVGVSYFF